MWHLNGALRDEKYFDRLRNDRENNENQRFRAQDGVKCPGMTVNG